MNAMMPAVEAHIRIGCHACASTLEITLSSEQFHFFSGQFKASESLSFRPFDGGDWDE